MTKNAEYHDLRRENLDSLTKLHLVLQMLLLPDVPVGLGRRSLADLEAELQARTIRMSVERERLEGVLAERIAKNPTVSPEERTRLARKRRELSAFLDRKDAK